MSNWKSKFKKKSKELEASLPELEQRYNQVCTLIGDRHYRIGALESEIAGYKAEAQNISRKAYELQQAQKKSTTETKTLEPQVSEATT